MRYAVGTCMKARKSLRFDQFRIQITELGTLERLENTYSGGNSIAVFSLPFLIGLSFLQVTKT